MRPSSRIETVGTLVIGGGQAGLSVGYHLQRKGARFLIVDGSERIGDTWRSRWDSLRLFTPARFSGLDGMPFPAPKNAFPTKSEMADYLAAYARRFNLPVESGVRIERLERRGDRFRATAGSRIYEADDVIVAMGSYQRPRVPDFAHELAPGIRALHSADYRNPDQLQPGPVLLVGAGNSGSEIAMELASRHPVWMSGRDVGEIPFRPRGLAGRLLLVRLVLRVLFHRVLTVRTPIGRRVRRRTMHQGGPLIRVKRRDLRAAGVERVPRVRGVNGGLPVLEDGRVLEPANVIWCTGFHPGFDWIDVDGLRGDLAGGQEPEHASGAVEDVPGLYFCGLHFLHAKSSEMIHGVGRDAERIAGLVAKRIAERGVDGAEPSPPRRRAANDVAPSPRAARAQALGTATRR